MKTTYLSCGTCCKEEPVKIKRTLTGLRKCTCPSCGKEHLFQLPGATKAFYVALLILVLFLIATARASGPGLLALIAGYALYKDWEIGNAYPTGRLTEQSENNL
jgi:hypothetical protein